MSYTIKALKSAGGQVTLKKGATYNVPGQIPDEVAKDLIRAKLATKEQEEQEETKTAATAKRGRPKSKK